MHTRLVNRVQIRAFPGIERAIAPIAAGPEQTAMIRATSSSTPSGTLPAFRSTVVATPIAPPLCACDGTTRYFCLIAFYYAVVRLFEDS